MRSISHLRRSLPSALLLALLVPALPVKAQESSEPAASRKELSEPVANALGELRVFADAKNYKEILRRIEPPLSAASADSYDLAVLLQVKGQMLIADSRHQAATAPIEASLRLGDRYGYFDQNAVLASLYTLAQLYYQQAADLKDLALQKGAYEKAGLYIERWLALSPKPSTDNLLLASSIRYNLGTLDAEHPDKQKLREAKAYAEKSLHLDHKVAGNQPYLLILASLQQLGETEQAAEVLERLVQRDPGNVSYWQQLVASYYTLANATKNERVVRRYNLRAIITYERAQARGLLVSPRDHFSVVALYLGIQQFDLAAQLLAKDLKSGAIQNTRRNWELLSAAYQQQHDGERAVAVLKDAAVVLPADGQIEFSLAQLYYSQEKTEEAYAHLESAVAKGNLDKPGQTRVFLATVAYELKRFDAAAKWARDAADQPDVKKEDLARINRAITDAGNERTTTL